MGNEIPDFTDQRWCERLPLITSGNPCSPEDHVTWDPANYKHQKLTEAIIRAFYEVYNELGHGFLESVYEEAMFRALKANEIAAQRQSPLPVWFRGEQIGDFRADLVVGGHVIVELKASRALEPVHEA